MSSLTPTVPDRVRAIIADQFDVRVANDQQQLNSSFRVDSMDVIELQLALEENLGIEIPLDGFDEYSTVADVIRVCERLTSKAGA